MKPSLKIVSTVLTATAITMAVACASRESENTDFRADMRDAYRATAELYTYVWSESEFYKPSSELHIQQLLNELSADFHRVEVNTPAHLFEPGFRTILTVHREMLADAKNRFATGHKEYANWKLRGIAGSCISCHSRLQTPVDFAGSPPQINVMTAEAGLAQAEFLFATRQFDAASDALKKIAFSPKSSPGVHERALKLWLVIQVRNKNDFAGAAAELKSNKSGSLPPEINAVDAWIADLEKLAARKPVPSLEEAALQLRGRSANDDLEEDNANLVKTLLASAYLHGLLQQNLSTVERRKATYLLSKAYYHMPIVTFDAYQQLYLEVTIRDYPHTDEAQAAYDMYENRLEFLNSGSGGTNLDPEDQRKLRELRTLAYPVTTNVISDASNPEGL